MSTSLPQPLKILGGAAALVTAALVGGTLIGSALGAPSGSASTQIDSALTADPGDGGEYCQVFLDAFASELGVGTEELAPAAQAAAIATVEAAVEAGDLTEEQGAALIERISNWDGEGCAVIGFHLRAFAHHAARVDFLHGMFEAAADVLGMTTAELREALADANLEEVAEDQGVDYADVVAAALASAEADLDAAVEAGKITQDQADAIYDRLETWLNNGGPGGWGDGPRPGDRPFRGDGFPNSTDADADGTSA